MSALNQSIILLQQEAHLLLTIPFVLLLCQQQLPIDSRSPSASITDVLSFWKSQHSEDLPLLLLLEFSNGICFRHIGLMIILFVTTSWATAWHIPEAVSEVKIYIVFIHGKQHLMLKSFVRCYSKLTKLLDALKKDQDSKLQIVPRAC